MFYLGVHTTKTTVQIALVRALKRGFQIDLIRELPLKNKHENVKPLYILRSILQDHQIEVITGLIGLEVLLREVLMPLKKTRDIIKALPYSLDNIVPIDESERIIVPILRTKKRDNPSLTILATTKSTLQNHLNTCAQLQLDPDLVTTESEALKSYVAFSIGPTVSCHYLHIDAYHTTIALFKLGEIEQTISFPFGYALLTDALYQDLPDCPESERTLLAKEIDLLHLDEKKHRNLKLASTLFSREFSRAYAYWKGKHPKLEDELFYTSSTTFGGIQLDSFLKEKLNRKMLLPPGITSIRQNEMGKFAIPVGYALEGLAKSSFFSFNPKVQFRTHEWEKKSFTLKNRRNILACSLSFILLFSSLCFVGNRHLHLKEKRIGTLLSSYSKTTISQNSSIKELWTRVEAFESKMKKESTKFVPDITVPVVSETIEWLLKHPVLSSNKAQGQFHINHFHYELEKFPSPDSLKTPYVAAVSLEFSCDSSWLAREFHDSLMQKEKFIDHIKKIEWSSDRNHYKVRFYLNKGAK